MHGAKTPPPVRPQASPVHDPKKDLSAEFARAAAHGTPLMASPAIKSPYHKKQRTADDLDLEPCFPNVQLIPSLGYFK